MKEVGDSRIYTKDGQQLRALCLMRTVEGLTIQGAYSRLMTWEKSPAFKDLDWVFRPLKWTRTQCRSILRIDDSEVFIKDGFKVTLNCVMECVGISRQVAFYRCVKWEENEEDLDWLFRPKDIKKSTAGSKSRILERIEKVEMPDNTEYVKMLRKQMGLPI